jgi:hypothetical protein
MLQSQLCLAEIPIWLAIGNPTGEGNWRCNAI